MDDLKITQLLFDNDEHGLSEVQKKYGTLIGRICGSILRSRTDVEDCSNDTLQAVWDSIPPNKPDNLAGFICKIARRIAISRIRYNTASVRNSDLLDELDECIVFGSSIEEEAEKAELSRVLNEWLETLSEKQKLLFVKRYYYFESVKEAARECKMSDSAAGTSLQRLRQSLKSYLIERGMVDGYENAEKNKSDHRSA